MDRGITHSATFDGLEVSRHHFKKLVNSEKSTSPATPPSPARSIGDFCLGSETAGDAFGVPEGIVLLTERKEVVTHKDVIDYAEWLGAANGNNKDLMWIPSKAMSSLLPEGWRACRRKSKKCGNEVLFYIKLETGETTEEHPLDLHWLSLFEQCNMTQGRLYIRNEQVEDYFKSSVAMQLRGAVDGPAERIFTADLTQPLGMYIAPDGAVFRVKPKSQAHEEGVHMGCQIMAVAGIAITTQASLCKIKRALTTARKRGDVSVSIVYRARVAAAIDRAEREYLCPDKLIARAKRRLQEGPEGPNAAAEDADCIDFNETASSNSKDSEEVDANEDEENDKEGEEVAAEGAAEDEEEIVEEKEDNLLILLLKELEVEDEEFDDSRGAEEEERKTVMAETTKQEEGGVRLNLTEDEKNKKGPPTTTVTTSFANKPGNASVLKRPQTRPARRPPSHAAVKEVVL